jgi:hypothetical protein
LRIRRIDHDLGRADRIVAVQRLRPRPAAVGGPENAAIRVLVVQIADGRDEDDVRVARIDGDARDVLGIVETDVRPVI